MQCLELPAAFELASLDRLQRVFDLVDSLRQLVHPRAVLFFHLRHVIAQVHDRLAGLLVAEQGTGR